jgi:hypothetical protein
LIMVTNGIWGTGVYMRSALVAAIPSRGMGLRCCFKPQISTLFWGGGGVDVFLSDLMYSYADWLSETRSNACLLPFERSCDVMSPTRSIWPKSEQSNYQTPPLCNATFYNAVEMSLYSIIS